MEEKLPKTFDDRSIRSFEEQMKEPKLDRKKFRIKTYGGQLSNNKELFLEANLDKHMWRDGVGRITIGDEVVYFDMVELLNYIRVCVE